MQAVHTSDVHVVVWEVGVAIHHHEEWVWARRNSIPYQDSTEAISHALGGECPWALVRVIDGPS